MGSGEDLIKSMFKAQAKYASYGITTAQEGMFVDELTELYKYFVSTDKVNIDIVGYVDIKAADQILPKLSEHVKQYNKHFKKIQPFKCQFIFYTRKVKLFIFLIRYYVYR